jgi:hypothetical protein
MKVNVAPYLISARIFGFNIFHQRAGKIQRTQFAFIMLSLTGCCLYRALIKYNNIIDGIANDDYEDATMAAIAGLRFIVLSFSGIPVFGMQIRMENSQIFSLLLKIICRTGSSTDTTTLQLRFIIRVFIFIVWSTLILFIAKQMVLWERQSLYNISESEFILVYRALQCLLEGEMVILVWLQQRCIKIINRQIQVSHNNGHITHSFAFKTMFQY